MFRILSALAVTLLLVAPPAVAQENPPAPGVAHSTAPRAASFTLRTGISQGRMVFIGSGGEMRGGGCCGWF